MVTAASLIRMSMQDLGVLGAGESGAGEHLSDGLRRLQTMVGGWSLEALTVVQTSREVFPLIPNKRTYTIGPGLELDTVRPVGQQSLKGVGLLLMSSDPPVEIPRSLQTYDQFRNTRIKELRSPLFTEAFYVPGATRRVPEVPIELNRMIAPAQIALWPVPTDPNQIVLYIERTLPMFEDLTTAYPVPDGLSAAIQYNLTVALAAMFQVEPSSEVVRQARLSYAAMKRTNYQMIDVAIDPMFTMQTPSGGYDIQTGSTRR